MCCYWHRQLGGSDQGSKEDAQRDMEALMAEGGEALPRLPRIWLGLTYEADGRGHLISPSTAHTGGHQRCRGAVSEGPHSLTLGGRSALVRPFDGDGSRAVAALEGQVRPLFLIDLRDSSIYTSAHEWHMLVGSPCIPLHFHLMSDRSAVCGVSAAFTGLAAGTSWTI